MTELIRQYLFIIDYTIFYLTHLPTTIQITKAIKFATIILAQKYALQKAQGTQSN